MSLSTCQWFTHDRHLNHFMNTASSFHNQFFHDQCPLANGHASCISWSSFASINSIITFKLKMNTDFISPSLRMFSWKVVTIRFFRAEWCEHICQLQSSCICLFHEGIEKHYTNMKKKEQQKISRDRLYGFLLNVKNFKLSTKFF